MSEKFNDFIEGVDQSPEAELAVLAEGLLTNLRELVSKNLSLSPSQAKAWKSQLTRMNDLSSLDHMGPRGLENAVTIKVLGLIHEAVPGYTFIQTHNNTYVDALGICGRMVKVGRSEPPFLLEIFVDPVEITEEQILQAIKTAVENHYHKSDKQ